MRLSNQRTTLAKLRLAIGLRQKEMADLLGVSASIIQNIELEKTDLPEDLADDAARLTGADVVWLLENDPRRPIINSNGEPFTMSDYEKRQAKLRFEKGSPASIAPRVETELASSLGKLIVIAEAALRSGRYDLFSYKISRALNGLCNEAHARVYRLPISKGEHVDIWPDLDHVVADWKTRHDWRAEFRSLMKPKLPAKRRAGRARKAPAL